MSNNKTTYRDLDATSLYANVGLGCYYAKDVNINVVSANELEYERAFWHQKVYPNCQMFQGSITNKKIFNEMVQKHNDLGCELILSSPPCQDFSNMGKKDLSNPRALLFLDVLEFARNTPNNQFITIENVVPFLSTPLDHPDINPPKHLKEVFKGKIMQNYIKEELNKMGYEVTIGVLNAADYGTPQKRNRAIILGSKKGKWDFPEKDIKHITLNDSIGHLPSIEAGEYSDIPFHHAPDLHPIHIETMKHTPTGCSAHDNPYKWKPKNTDGSPSKAKFKATYSRMCWDKPAACVLQGSDSIGANYSIHPGRLQEDGTYSDARCLSILELLLVNGLPADYPIPNFARNKDKFIREVIGECFPPLFVKKILETMPR